MEHMESIDVRDLQQNAGTWLARVAAGESFAITDRGRPIAALVPAAGSESDQLVASGAVSAATRDLRDVAAMPAGGVGPSLSDLLAEDRRRYVRH